MSTTMNTKPIAGAPLPRIATADDLPAVERSLTDAGLIG